jgi:ribonuclease VapC
MIIDTSVLVAIFTNEPDRERFLEAIDDAPQRSIAAPTLLETFIVLRRFGRQLATVLDEFVRAAGIAVIPFDEAHLAAAMDADRRFGRGTGHPAKLNFGDCFSYAAAAVSGRPLLFKGEDFTYTDVLAATLPP